MLEELSNNLEVYKKFAIKITGSKVSGEDLLSELIIKLHNKNISKDKIKDSFIYTCLRNQHYDNVKKKKVVHTLDNYEILCNEFVKYEQEHEDYDLIKLKRCLAKLDYNTREILLERQVKSLREIAGDGKHYSYSKIFTMEKEGMQKLKELYNTL